MKTYCALFSRRAFTLIELLVVIAIISILAVMILRMSTSALRAASTAECVSNQKQISVAMFEYAMDNDGFLPPYTTAGGTRWDDTLSELMASKTRTAANLKKVFVCAGEAKTPVYGYNYLVSDLNNDDGTPNIYRKLVRILDPAQKVMLGCVEQGGSISCNVATGGYNRMSRTHDDGDAVVLYVDGHAAPLKDLNLNYHQTFDPSVIVK